jgi:hypothetical protein
MKLITGTRGEEEALVRLIDRAANFLFPQWSGFMYVICKLNDLRPSSRRTFSACLVLKDYEGPPGDVVRLTEVSTEESQEAALTWLLRDLQRMQGFIPLKEPHGEVRRHLAERDWDK